MSEWDLKQYDSGRYRLYDGVVRVFFDEVLSGTTTDGNFVLVKDGQRTGDIERRRIGRQLMYELDEISIDYLDAKYNRDDIQLGEWDE